MLLSALLIRLASSFWILDGWALSGSSDSSLRINLWLSGTNTPTGTELAPPPKDYYNISIKEQVYGKVAPITATSYRNKKKKRPSCKCRNPCYWGRCSPCRCCCWWLISLIFLIGVAALVFYLVVRPKAPAFEVTDFRLEGLDTSLTAQQMSTTSTVTISSRNGNKNIAFDYKSINVHITTNVKTGDVSVGDGTLPAVFQGKGETVKLQGTFKATPMAMGKDTQAALIKAQSTRNFPLKVNVDLKTRLQVGPIKFIKLKVKVRCQIAVDPSVKTGSQILNKHCDYSARPYV
ncbi:hypothetical protein R1sor_023646 [Riccia sorocarpa]|uniref:Late embryogenesis abundant protein LEA-2 subgroup domain-containing protein n=1 Tax=Riccia sorocarpa TaxID=122646 RepID=A0ABD3GRG3_9MARC